MAPRESPGRKLGVYRAVIDPYSKKSGVEVADVIITGTYTLFPGEGEFYENIDNADEVLEHFEKINHKLLGVVVDYQDREIYFVSVKETDSGVSIYLTKSPYGVHRDLDEFGDEYEVITVFLDELEQVEELNFENAKYIPYEDLDKYIENAEDVLDYYYISELDNPVGMILDEKKKKLYVIVLADYGDLPVASAEARIDEIKLKMKTTKTPVKMKKPRVPNRI